MEVVRRGLAGCSAASRYDGRITTIARLLARLAAIEPEMAEHAEATGDLAGRIARYMGLSAYDAAEVTFIGALHEVGILLVPGAHGTAIAHASDTELLRTQRLEREAAMSIIAAEDQIAHLAEAVGSTFDDVVTSLRVRIVVVADAYDYLIRAWRDRAAVPQRDALRILEAHAGIRYDPAVVAALCAMLRVSPRLAIRELGA